LFKAKEGENLALESFTACNYRNTLSILRIALKLHFVPKFEPDAGIGQKEAFCKGLLALVHISLADKRLCTIDNKLSIPGA